MCTYIYIYIDIYNIYIYLYNICVHESRVCARALAPMNPPPPQLAPPPLTHTHVHAAVESDAGAASTVGNAINGRDNASVTTSARFVCM